MTRCRSCDQEALQQYLKVFAGNRQRSTPSWLQFPAKKSPTEGRTRRRTHNCRMEGEKKTSFSTAKRRTPELQATSCAWGLDGGISAPKGLLVH